MGWDEETTRGVMNYLPILIIFAGRGGGGSLADNEIQLCAVPIFEHPIVDGERIADAPWAPAKRPPISSARECEDPASLQA